MSTRSAIGQQQPDGTIKAVYCHFDGYPDGVGQTLIDWTAGQPLERRKFVVDKLLAEKIGWSQLVKTDIDLEPAWTERSWRDTKPEREAPQSYTARGETDEMSQDFADVADISKHMGVSYIYIFSADLQSLSVYRAYTGDLLTTVSLDAPLVLDEQIKDEDE